MVTMVNAAAKMAIPRCHDPPHSGMDHARSAELTLALGIAGAGGGANSLTGMAGMSIALAAPAKPLGRASLAGKSLGPDFCPDCGRRGFPPLAASSIAHSRSAVCTPTARA